jgi:hypothetical protein
MSVGLQKPFCQRVFRDRPDALVALEYATQQCQDDLLKELQRSCFSPFLFSTEILRQLEKQKPPEGGFG